MEPTMTDIARFPGLSNDPMNNAAVVEEAAAAAVAADEALVFPLKGFPTEGFILPRGLRRVIGNGCRLKHSGPTPIISQAQDLILSDLQIDSTATGTVMVVGATFNVLRDIRISAPAATTALLIGNEIYGTEFYGVYLKGTPAAPKTAGSAGLRFTDRNYSTRWYGGTIDHFENNVVLAGDTKVTKFDGALIENPGKAAFLIPAGGLAHTLTIINCSAEHGECYLRNEGELRASTLLNCNMGGHSMAAVEMTGKSKGVTVWGSSFTSLPAGFVVRNGLTVVLAALNSTHTVTRFVTGSNGDRLVTLEDKVGGRQVTFSNTSPTATPSSVPR
jgi:hypothetical protein